MNTNSSPAPGSNSGVTRRSFLKTTATSGAAATTLGRSKAWRWLAVGVAPGVAAGAEAPAALGGRPARTAPFPSWPVIERNDEDAWMEVLRSGKWFRGYGNRVTNFEDAYARLMGAKHCVATANGTSALFASLGGLEIGPGDEVILPPYTFVATLNVILLQHALPVFVDSDSRTFQIDAGRIEAAVTDRTAALLPVHLGGNVADMDAILDVAKRRRLRVIEDACQSHLAEWRGRRVGSLGDAGCFSFQASKNLNCGEGGAILAQDAGVAEKCYAFHNNGRGRGTAGAGATHLAGRGANLRLTEFQAALLVSQMTRIEEQSRTRDRNAAHLTGLLREIPGITPAGKYDGCTRNAWHLYMFRYSAEAFAGLSRSAFLRALSAEGVSCSSGYTPLNREPFLKAALASRAYRRIYPPDILDRWEERNQCPANDQLCREAVWFTQTMLLGPQSDMDQIAEAVRKIQANASKLARA